MGFWKWMKKKWKKAMEGSTTIKTKDGRRIKPHKSRDGKPSPAPRRHITDNSVDRSVQARNAMIKHQAKQAVKTGNPFRMNDPYHGSGRSGVKAAVQKTQNVYRKQNNGMSKNDFAMNDNLSRMGMGAKKAYETLEKHGSKNAGIDKGFTSRTVHAEEEAAKTNPFLYNMFRQSAPFIDTKTANEIKFGREINDVVDYTYTDANGKKHKRLSQKDATKMARKDASTSMDKDIKRQLREAGITKGSEQYNAILNKYRKSKEYQKALKDYEKGSVKGRKSDETVGGVLGGLTGAGIQFATTGLPLEGAVVKGLKGSTLVSKAAAKGAAKGVAKKGAEATLRSASKKATAKAIKEVTKKTAKGAGEKAVKQKVKDFGVRRAADAIVSSGMNVSMGVSEATNYKGYIDKKQAVKNAALNTATDMAFGGAFEGIGKVGGKVVKAASGKVDIAKSIAKANIKAKEARIDYHKALENVKKADTPEAKAKAQVEAKVQKKVAEKAQAKADAIYNENVVKAKADTNVKATAKAETDVPVQKTSQEVTTQAQREVNPQKAETVDNDVKSLKTENRASKLEEQKLPEQEVKIQTKNETHVSKDNIKDKAKAKKDEYQRRFVDSLAFGENEARRLNKEAARIRKHTDGNINDKARISAMEKNAMDISDSANDLRQSASIADRAITNKQMDIAGKETGKGLKEIYKGLENVKGFKNADEAEHTLSKLMVERQNISRAKEGRSVNGKTSKESEAIVKQIEKDHPEILKIEKDVRTYINNNVKLRKDAGLIDEATAQKWTNNNYVPTRRDVPKTKSGKDKSLGEGNRKRAKGNNSYDILPIKEQLAEQTRELYSDIHLNRYLKSLSENENVLSNASQIRRSIASGYKENAEDVLTFLEKHDGKYYATTWENGERHVFEIPEEAYLGIKEHFANGHLNNALDDVANALSGANRVFKDLITNLNAWFIVKNFARDLPEAMINTKSLKNFFASMPEVIKHLARGEKDEWFRAFMNTGISHSSFLNMEKALKAKDKNWVKKLNPLYWVEQGNFVAEMFPRYCEFLGTLKKAGFDTSKMSPDEIPANIMRNASHNAADVTVNFGRSGIVSKNLNKGFAPFFNVSVQGASKFVRNISEIHGAKAYLSFAAKATVFGVAPAVINEFVLQNNPNYQKLSARDKQNYFIFPIPPTNDATFFVKIPKSRFGTAYGLIAQAAVSKDKDEWASIIQVLPDAVAPVNPLESNLLSPILNTARNKTWYGGDIETISEQGRAGGKAVPIVDRKNNNTTSMAVKLAKTKVARALGLSPKKIDYLADSYGGVIYDVLAPGMTNKNKGLGTKGAVKQVFKKQFALDSDLQSATAQKYYRKIESLGESDKPEDRKTLQRMKSWQSRGSVLNRAIKKAEASNDPNKEAKIKLLQRTRDTIFQKALDGKRSIDDKADVQAIKTALGAEEAIRLLHHNGSKEVKIMEAYKNEKGKVDNAFWKGYTAIRSTQNRIRKATGKSANDELTNAVALASVNADKLVCDAYGFTNKGSKEVNTKYKRAKEFFKNGGTLNEYTAYKSALQHINYQADEKEKKWQEKIEKLKGVKGSARQLAALTKELNVSRNTSYTVKALQLARMNAGDRAYILFDIKDRNVQNGINLAALGVKPREFRKIKQSIDSDKNGYVKKTEAVNYLNAKYGNDNAKKSALFSAMAAWNARNPYGIVTYSRKEAAANGKEDRRKYSYTGVDEKKTKTVTKMDYGKYRDKKDGKLKRPVSITFRNGKTMSLKNLSEKERNFILANAKGVRSIQYGTYGIKVKDKEEVKEKPKKDNSKIPESKDSGGGGYSRRGRSWRHYYGRGGGGGRVSMPDTLSPAKEKITDVTYRSPLSLTVEQPSKKSDLRKIMKAYRNNFSKFKV